MGGRYIGWKMIADKIRSQAYIEYIEKEKAANELNFLRAQFNPHFLFNSINAIYGHIDKSNKSARDMLLKFSEMLRYQLYECNVDLIDLDREVNYIRNYIDLQKSRMNERIDVRFCDEGPKSSERIAPLLLITFIENAFKYVGFDEHQPNYVRISLHRSEAKLRFNVINSRDGYINGVEGSSGLGLVNVRRRLELLYPGRHLLEIHDGTNNFEVNLELDNL